MAVFPSEILDSEHAVQLYPALVQAWRSAGVEDPASTRTWASSWWPSRYAPLPADPGLAEQERVRGQFSKERARVKGAPISDPSLPVPVFWSLAAPEPPETGWSTALCDDTMQLARSALAARQRASVARRVAADGDATPSARRKAASEVSEMDAYAAAAELAVRESSKAWLPALTGMSSAATSPQPSRIGNW